MVHGGGFNGHMRHKRLSDGRGGAETGWGGEED